jgi:predicted metal-dependent peptidase
MHTFLARGRRTACKAFPYFAPALLALRPSPRHGMMQEVGGAMGVSASGVLFYDPDYITEHWRDEDVAFGYVHEAVHLLRRHAQQCEAEGYDPKLWNIACDAAINDDLLWTSLRPLATDVLPHQISHKGKPMPRGLTERAYYRALVQEKANPSSKAADGQGQSSGPGAGDAPDPWDSGIPGVTTDQAPIKGRPGSGQCGGIAGNPFEFEEADMTAGDVEGMSPFELAKVRQKTAIKIREHVLSAGLLPGSWAVWAEEELGTSQVSWQQELRFVLSRMTERSPGVDDYARRGIARRQWGLELVLDGPAPLLYSTVSYQGDLVIVVDTSGSMNSVASETLTEVKGILDTIRANFTFMSCDAAVQAQGEVSSWTDALKLIKGGGGTSFIPAFEAVDKLSRRPQGVIVLTDGYGPAPAAAPAYPVVWGLVGDRARTPYQPGGRDVSYGRVVRIPLLSLDDGARGQS